VGLNFKFNRLVLSVKKERKKKPQVREHIYDETKETNLTDSNLSYDLMERHL